MNKKRFWISVLLVAAMLLSVCACGGNSDKTKDNSSSDKLSSSNVGDDNASDSNASSDDMSSSDGIGSDGSSDNSQGNYTGNSNGGTSNNGGSSGNSNGSGTSGGSGNQSNGSQAAPKPTYTGPDYKVNVDLNTVVNQQFDGIGGNVVPMNLISGYNQGYNDAYWDSEVSRINKVNVPLVRFWMQVDWLEQEKDVPNWNSPQMKAVYKYLDAFKAAGINVQITYNWKVGDSIQNWFSIPGLEKPGESAPRDLDHFARSCYRLIKGLHDRGYTNVKYLTYANEPNIGDFECYGDQLAYYILMSQKVSDYFKKMNYRDKIELWGCESSECSQWVLKCAQQVGTYDSISWHSYAVTSESILTDLSTIPNVGIWRRYLSEFSESSEPRWYRGLAGVAINGANNGLTGVLNWCLNGVGSMSTDPNSAGGWNMTSSDDFWNSYNMSTQNRFGYTDSDGNFIKPIEIGRVNRSYYIASLFGTYITRGSKVVKSTVNTQGMRSATFVDKKTGDITVAVEFNENTQNRNITVDFGKNVNKTFYKHVYTDNIKRDQNATVIPTSATFKNVGKTLKDNNVEKEYSIVIYTTKAPVKQVEFNNAFVELKAGESFKFTADVVDGTGNEQIEWKILTAANHKDSNIGRKGTLTVNGKTATYTAASNAIGADPTVNEHQDVISIEARIKGTDIYTVAIVRITK